MADMNQTTEEMLAERKKTHGEYSEHARATQELLRAMQRERNWPILSDMQKETLHMIAHKVGRILTGDPNTADHYDDIAGYAKLISQRLERPVAPADIGGDLYMALAVAWNCSRDEAKKRALAVLHSGKAGAESPAQAQMRADKAEQHRIDMDKAEHDRASIRETINDGVRKIIGELDLRNKGGL